MISMETEASESLFETSEMVATFLASTPLVKESWSLCLHANAAAPMGFVTEIRGGVGYLAFSGVQTPESISDPAWGRVAPFDTAVFGPLLRRTGDNDGNDDAGNNTPAMVHAGLLQLFLSMLNSQTFITQVMELREKCKAIVMTGHSLGGAIASLSTLWLLSHLQNLSSSSPSLLCITFGSPLLGTKALTRALLRERWAANFCHVISNHDLLPRLLFAPSAALAPPTPLLLHHWHSSMRGHASHEAPLGAAELLGHVVASCGAPGEAESLFWPFGNYLMFSKEGVVCLDDAACVAKMMRLTLVAGFSLSASLDDHLRYGDYIAWVPLRYLKRESLIGTGLPQTTTYEAGLAVALHSTGISLQEPEAAGARECLRTARRLGLAPVLNCAKLAVNLSKVVPYRAQVEWFKASCDEAPEQTGYYDAFKQRGSSKRGTKINMNRLLLAEFWDGVIEKLENNQLPYDFPTRDKWVNALHFYKLLVEPLDIAEYYRKERHLVEGHYLGHARPRRYQISDAWWRERRAGKDRTGPRTKLASQTQDSCFWARLEEAKEWLDRARHEDAEIKGETWENIRRFDAYAKGLVERKEVSKDVVAKNSSYTKWTEDLRKLGSATVCPTPPLNPMEF